MKRSHIKLGLFYISTVIAVVILFGAVTSHGESSLKGANSIEGVYTLQQDWQSPRPFPTCLSQPRTSWLVLHQSGIFLNASLVQPTEASEPEQEITDAIREPTTLTGRFENQVITLNGQLTSLVRCQNLFNVNLTQATIQAKVEQRDLVGTLDLGTGVIAFRGVWQESPLSSSQLKGKGH